MLGSPDEDEISVCNNRTWKGRLGSDPPAAILDLVQKQLSRKLKLCLVLGFADSIRGLEALEWIATQSPAAEKYHMRAILKKNLSRSGKPTKEEAPFGSDTL